MCEDSKRNTEPLHATGSWRKKSPSETRRDRQRAEERRQQQQNQQKQLEKNVQQQQSTQQNRKLKEQEEVKEASAVTTPTTTPRQHGDNTVTTETRNRLEITDKSDSSMDTENIYVKDKQDSASCDISPGLFKSCHDIESDSDTSSTRAVDTSALLQDSCKSDEAIRRAMFDTLVAINKQCAEWSQARKQEIVSTRADDCVVRGTVDKSKECLSDIDDDGRNEIQELERMAERIGYNLEDVKEHVGSVTNRHQQRLLQDTRRNNKIF